MTGPKLTLLLSLVFAIANVSACTTEDSNAIADPSASPSAESSIDALNALVDQNLEYMEQDSDPKDRNCTNYEILIRDFLQSIPSKALEYYEKSVEEGCGFPKPEIPKETSAPTQLESEPEDPASEIGGEIIGWVYYEFLPSDDLRCERGDARCKEVKVTALRDCSQGIYAEVNFLNADDVVIDWSNARLPALREQQDAILYFGSFEGDADQVEVVSIECYSSE